MHYFYFITKTSSESNKMLFYTENVSKFAFSNDINDLDLKSRGSSDTNMYAILGVPFDGTTSYKPGARFGPRAIREASYNFERYNLNLNKKLTADIYDMGDLEVVHGNFNKTCSRLKTTVSEIRDMGMVPIIIGGDHSISYGVLKAMDDSEGSIFQNITVIHFDAHMDLRDTYLEEKYSHATVMQRIFELNPKEIVQIGVRSASEYEAIFASENIRVFRSRDVVEDIEEVRKFLENIEGPVYISFDIDVLDPAYAPEVGTPCSCGLNPKQVEKLIYSLIDKEIVGFDMVEVSSTKIGDITSLNAAKIIYDVLCLR